jgi:hypothetical protein
MRSVRAEAIDRNDETAGAASPAGTIEATSEALEMHLFESDRLARAVL